MRQAIDNPPGLSSLYLTSSAPRPPLSIGLLLDGVMCPRFVARILDDIAACDFARIDLAVYHDDDAPPPAPRAGLPRRMLRLLRDDNARRLLLYDLYLRLDGRRRAPEDDPLALVDVSATLAGVDAITVKPLRKGFTHRFTSADVEQIRARDLDVLLRFGFNILHGEILTSARYGVWSFHHDDNDEYRGGPAGFWELYEDNPVSGVMLQVLTEQLDAGVVLCKSRFLTAPGASLARNRHAPYWGSTHFVIRKLHELHAFGWDRVRERAEPSAPYRGRRETYKRPGNPDMARFVGRVLMRSARNVMRAPLRSRPRLAIRAGARPFDGRDRVPTDHFTWLPCPRGHAYTDPFLIGRDGVTWAFFRDYSYAVGRGVIVCAEVLPSGRLGAVRACLESSDDLVYPMVLESDGDVFMIPGAASGGGVDLYRATRFPYEWTLEKRVHSIRAVTTTACRAGDRWWFFVSIAESPGHCAALHLFHAPSLTAPWTCHPASPISSDARTARGAGAIFRLDGRLIRPAHAAGAARPSVITLNEILELGPDTYRDRPMVGVEAAGRGGIGCGTYAHGAGVEMIDGWPSLVHRRSGRRQGV